MTTAMIYTLDTINEILFNGFDYKLPDETLEIISNLALQVGSPDYVKTPVFLKRDNPMKVEPVQKEYQKKNKRGKAVEVVNDGDWETIRTFQTTKIEEKEGYEDDIDNHIHLNAPFTCLGVYEWDDVITDLPSITIEQSYTCYCYNTPRETEYFTITADIITNKVVMDYLIEKEFDPACNHSFLEGFHKKENGYWEIMLGS